MASSRFGCRDGFMLAGRMTERRGLTRPRSARLVQVTHAGDTAYARCRDFSDTGMKLDLTDPLAINDEVTISLSPSIVLCGTVAWMDGRKCGIVFDGPVDSAALLDAVSDGPAETAPPATLDLLHRRRTAHDLPHRHERNERLSAVFKPGLSVTVMVAPDRERRGVFHWAADNAAALELDPAEPELRTHAGLLPAPNED